MSEKNQKDAALDSANAEGKIEYTPEQVAEDERREARAEQFNKKLPSKPEVAAAEPDEKGGKKKH
jgi:hypothetical protein